MRGEQSTLAPTSITTTGLPISVGKMPASAGRSTPCMTPCTILAVAMTAPVLPAETNPCAMPSRTRRGAPPPGTFGLCRAGPGRPVPHCGLVGGVDHLHRQAAVVVVLLQLPPQNFLPADQDDPDPQRSGRLDGPLDFRFRGVVSAHCVNSNGDHVGRVATPARLPRLRGPCIVRSAGTRDAAAWAHDSWGIRTSRAFSTNRAHGDFVSVAQSGVVSDSAFRYLKDFTPELRGFQNVFRSFRPWRAAHRLPACSSVQSHGVSLRSLPHVGQIPLQSSLQTRRMGMTSRICSRKMSSNSIPPP